MLNVFEVFLRFQTVYKVVIHRFSQIKKVFRTIALILLSGVILMAWGGDDKSWGFPNFFGSPSAVSPIRLERMQRGVNLSHWFAQVDERHGSSPEHFRHYITTRDLELLQAIALDHVRLPVNPEFLFDMDQPDKLLPEALASLDEAIALILAHHLAVIVDLHPDPEFKEALRTGDQFVDTFGQFWHTFARHLSHYDPDWLFLEILNEPEIHQSEHWAAIQQRLIEQVRSAAPDHTLIATGDNWSAVADLVALEPLADHNIVYNFHFYDPSVFTHQGADWAYPAWFHLRGVPYPSHPQAIAKLLPQVADEDARYALREYGDQRWHRGKIETKIQQVAAWAKQHNVKVICNEFGVFKYYVDALDRAQWLRDVRQTLENQQIGWTMWDYAGGFALVLNADKERQLDPIVVQALGLTKAAF